VTFDANHNITLVRLLSLNVDSLATSGIDAEISYRLPLKSFSSLPGALSLHLFGTYVDHLTTTDAGVSVDRAGAFGNNTPPAGVPRLTANAIVGYDIGPLSLSTQVRYFSGGKYDATLIGPQDAGYSPNLANSINDNRVPGATYVNLTAQLDLAKVSGPPVEVFATVDNLFDKDPPMSPSLNGTNPVNTVYYDVIGRTYRLGVRVRL
jgi:iron complex outermembrane receptor protein